MKQQWQLWTTKQRLCELVALSILIGMWLFVWRVLPTLPETIPTHYNFAGEIDAYGSKYTLVMIPAIATAMMLLLTIVTFFPKAWNLPVKVTPQNEQQMYHLGRWMLISLKVEILALFGFLTWQTTVPMQLITVFMPIALLILFGSLGYITYRMVQLK